MAASNLKGKVAGQCIVDVIMNSRKYAGVRLGVLKDLCTDVIPGQGFQARHRRVVFKYGGRGANLLFTGGLETCPPSAASAVNTLLFDNLLPECNSHCC